VIVLGPPISFAVFIAPRGFGLLGLAVVLAVVGLLCTRFATIRERT
jgi:hypothetical protein